MIYQHFRYIQSHLFPWAPLRFYCYLLKKPKKKKILLQQNQFHCIVCVCVCMYVCMYTTQNSEEPQKNFVAWNWFKCHTTYLIWISFHHDGKKFGTSSFHHDPIVSLVNVCVLQSWVFITCGKESSLWCECWLLDHSGCSFWAEPSCYWYRQN